VDGRWIVSPSGIFEKYPKIITEEEAKKYQKEDRLLKKQSVL
jgi:hypothetical protein